MILGKGIANFSGMQDYLTFMFLKDPSELCPSGFHSQDSVPIFTRAGKALISSKKYMELVLCFQPEIYTTLSDGDSSFDSAKKRILKSTDRSINFFEECVKIHNNSDLNSQLVASLVGGNNLKERQRMIQEVRKCDELIFGYFLDGFHYNGSSAFNLDQKELLDVVKHSLELLPNEKLKMMAGCYSPSTILKLVALGIDVFDTSLAYLMTKNNKAFTFSVGVESSSQTNPFIDLTEESYKDDFAPLLENCDCYACKKSSRAYINHLLNTNELVGPLYLMIHNLHHYFGFFESIRKCVQTDQLPELTANISKYNWDSLKFEEKIVENKK
jgi:queuine tRNA-ribosyltransferase subunit QTRTD1